MADEATLPEVPEMLVKPVKYQCIFDHVRKVTVEATSQNHQYLERCKREVNVSNSFCCLDHYEYWNPKYDTMAAVEGLSSLIIDSAMSPNYKLNKDAEQGLDKLHVFIRAIKEIEKREFYNEQREKIHGAISDIEQATADLVAKATSSDYTSYEDLYPTMDER